MIKVYGVPQSRTFRTLWMLEELGLAYEHSPVHFASGETKKPEFLALNPNGKIPVLVDGDTQLWESMAINLYLARRYDGGLQPKSLEDEAHALKWSFWVMTEVEKTLLDVLFNRVILPENERSPDVAAAAEQQLAAPLAVLDGALARRDFLIGDRFSVADLNVAAVLSWARFAGIDLSATPNVERWLTASLDRPAARKAQGR